MDRRSAMSVPTTLVSLQVWPTRTIELKSPLDPSTRVAIPKGALQLPSALLQTLATIVRCLKLAGKFSELYDIRAIGCTAYVHHPGEICPKKHSPHARKGTLIGYNSSQNSKYRILMEFKTGEIVETKDVTFGENVPNLRGDHWFAPNQLQVPPSVPALVSTSVSDSTDSDTATVHTDDPDSSLVTATSSPPPDDSIRPVDDTIIITQDNIDDFLDEPSHLQSKRTRT